MRNLSEQKKTFSPLIALFFMAIIFAIIFLVFYLNAIDITASVFGIRFYDFEDELVKVDDYDIDEGDAMLYMEKGSKVILKVIGFDEMKENDVIAFYYNDEGEDIIVTQIYKGKDVGFDGETVYYVHDLDNAEINAVNKADRAFYDYTISRTPARRWAQPSEIGAAAAFLVSPAASFITGQTLCVDGGLSIAL